jgi:hypothetical protein
MVEFSLIDNVTSSDLLNETDRRQRKENSAVRPSRDQNPEEPFSHFDNDRCGARLTIAHSQAVDSMEADHSFSPSLSSTSSKPSILSSTDMGGSSRLRSDDGGASSTAGSSLSLASAESRMVFRSKLLVFLVLFVAATACGITAYIFAKETELQEFRQQVRRTSNRTLYEES